MTSYLISAVLVFVASFSVRASEPLEIPSNRKVKVTSFYALNGNRGASELCGHIEGGTFKGDQITVIADPKYNPAKYVVLPAHDGNFCLVLVSVTGNANVELRNEGRITSLDVSTSNETSRVQSH